MNLRPVNWLRIGVPAFGLVYALSKAVCSQGNGSGTPDSSHAFIDTICTIPYLNEANITDLNNPLVLTSKEAILSTGISEAYFNEHFKLLCAVDNYAGGHRLVRWRYSIGEYAAILSDDIGTIQYDLNGLREIREVISLKKARRKMRRCIGKFKEAHVFLGHPPSNDRQTNLYLVARSVKEVRGLDITWEMGFVDLETGACEKTKGGMIHPPLGPTPKGSGR